MRTSTRALAGLGIAAGALAAFALLREGADERGGPRREPPAPVEESLDSVRDAGGGSIESALAPPADPPPAGERTPASVEDSAEPAAFLVEVVDAATLAPVPGAEIRWLANRGLSAQACLVARLEREGASARADAAGVARLATRPSDEVALLARAGSLAGEAVLAAPAVAPDGERRERVLVYTDWDLVVEVLDHAGAPAPGVPLRLSARSTRGGYALGGLTGADGRAFFAGAGHELGRAGRPLHVGVSLPFADDVEATIERAPPGGRVVLRLPPLGALDVRVADERGAPAADGTNVTLEAPRLARTRELARSVVRAPARTTTTLSGGVARFEHVGLGLELRVSAAGTHASARAEVEGPRAAGELVVVELSLLPDRTTLRLRALDEAREPVAGELSLVTTVRSAMTSSSMGTSVSADTEGRFELVLDSALVGGERRELVVSARGGALRGGVDLTAPLASGVVEHGDVVLLAQPLVAAGRVVGEDGEPVEGAFVSWSGSDGPLPSPGAETGADGAFALHGSTREPRVTLSGSHRLLEIEPAVVDVGASGVELVARRAGALEGSLLLDEGVPPRALALRLVRGGEAEPDSPPLGHGTVETGVPLRVDGRFASERLAPGTYRLVVRGGSELLAEVAGLEVRPGETCRDPRIQGLDLRGRMRTYRIELVAPAPGVELAGTLRFGAAGSGSLSRSLDFHGSPVLLATPLARVDASVHVEGCRVERLADLAPVTEVLLRAGHPVRLALPPGVAPPEPPLFVGVTLEDGVDALDSARFLDARGEVALLAPEPGPRVLRWCVERRVRGSTTRSVLALPERTILVEERDGEQRFELALTSEELAAALEGR